MTRSHRLRLCCGMVILAAGLWGCAPKITDPPPSAGSALSQHVSSPSGTATVPAESASIPTMPPPTTIATGPQTTVTDAPVIPTEPPTAATEPTVPVTAPTLSVTEPTVPVTEPTMAATTPHETEPAPTESTVFHVSFRDHDGKTLAEFEIPPGTPCPLPPDPVRSGYVFAGWEGDHRSITGDTLLTACYVPVDAPNLFTAESSVSGDTVAVTVRLQGSIETCGIECQLDYDETVLEFVGMTKHNSVEANHIAPDGNRRLILVWAGASNMTAGTIRDGGILLEVQFRVIDPTAADTWLSFPSQSMVVDVVNEDGSYSGAAFTLTKGVVHLK